MEYVTDNLTQVQKELILKANVRDVAQLTNTPEMKNISEETEKLKQQLKTVNKELKVKNKE